MIQIDPLYHHNIKISSTKIRNFLFRNNFILTKMLLGCLFNIFGKVVYGKKIGRIIGYPTANILINTNFALNDGVYAVKVRYQLNSYFLGMSNMGIKASDLNNNRILEMHLFYTDINLYEKKNRSNFL